MSTNYTGQLQPQIEEGILKTEWIPKDGIKDFLNDAFENIRIIVLEVLDSNLFRNK
jgi:hypothetical protein